MDHRTAPSYRLRSSALRLACAGAAAFACSCSRPAGTDAQDVTAETSTAAPSHRLYDLVSMLDQARIVPAQAGAREAASSLPAADFFRASNEARRSVLIQHPCRIEWNVDCPPGSVLVFAVGKKETAVPVHVRAATGGGPDGERMLCDQTFASGRGWEDFRLPLPERRFTGTLSIEFAWDNPKNVVYLGGAGIRAPGPRAAVAGADPQTQHRAVPNVLWYVIDTLRADHLGVAGYGRETGPNIRALAGEGAYFSHCFANDTWTFQSVASMFSGVRATTHQLAHPRVAAPPGFASFAEALRAGGWKTGAVSENPNVSPETGLMRGFETVTRSHWFLPRHRMMSKDPRLSDATYGCVQAFLNGAAGQPFFLYVHTIEPHAPYGAPPPFRRFSSAGSNGADGDVGRYDDGVYWADANLGRVIELLKSKGLYDDTIVVVCSDHGESLPGDEGGTGHGGPPYLARLRVPLVFRWPKAFPPGARIDRNVQLIDIAPTLLDALVLPLPAWRQGTSLLPSLRGPVQPESPRKPIYCAGQRLIGDGVVQDDTYLLRLDGTNYLYDDLSRFHRVDAPGGAQLAVLDGLAKDLAAHVAQEKENASAWRTETGGSAAAAEWPPELQEQLSALGYQ